MDEQRAALSAASKKKDACMKKHAPKLHKEAMTRKAAMQKEILQIAFSDDTPSAKKERLKKLLAKEKVDDEYLKALLSHCMPEVTEMLRQMAEITRALCEQNKTKECVKIGTKVNCLHKKAEAGKLTPKDMKTTLF